MCNPDNQLRSETVLQRKVKKIAEVLFTFHIFGLVGEILSENIIENIPQEYKISDSWLHIYTEYMAIETSIVLIICICLFVGATKQNKYLLIPFMLVSSVRFLFLIGVLLECIFALWSTGNPSAFIALAFLLLLIFIQIWMIKTTFQYYKELNTKQNREGIENLSCATDSHLQAIAPSRNDVSGHAPLNQASGQTSSRFPSALNENENFNSQPVRPEHPPTFSDTVVVSKDSTIRGDPPPSYDITRYW